MVLGFSLLTINYCNHFTLVIEFSHLALVRVFTFYISYRVCIVIESCKLVLKSPIRSY